MVYIYIAYRHPLDGLFGISTYDKELKRKCSNSHVFFLHKNEKLRKQIYYIFLHYFSFNIFVVLCSYRFEPRSFINSSHPFTTSARP